MQYGNISPSAYSQLKIHIVIVETENKEKIEELNQKIGNTSSTFSTQLNNQIATIEKNIEEVKSSIPNKLNADWETVKANANKVPGIESTIPNIPSDLNEEWETVKENANREIPTIPTDLNANWETVKESANREIPTIPTDLNANWETVKENANREIPNIPTDLNEEWETVKANANKIPGIEEDIDNIKSTLQTQSGSGLEFEISLPIDISNVTIYEESLTQYLETTVGDIKRNIPDYLIAGVGIKIERRFHVLIATTPATVDINEIIYVKDICVVVGASGTIFTSPGSITWTKRSSGITDHLMRVVYANNIFVAMSLVEKIHY